MSERPDRADEEPAEEVGLPAPAGGGLPAEARASAPARFVDRVRRSGIVIHMRRQAPPDGAEPGAASEVRFSLEVPVLGLLSVTFGAISLFQAPLILSPLAIVIGAAAVWRDQPGLGILGAGLAIAGLFTSSLFWGLVGLSWLWSRIF